MGEISKCILKLSLENSRDRYLYFSSSHFKSQERREKEEKVEKHGAPDCPETTKYKRRAWEKAEGFFSVIRKGKAKIELSSSYTFYCSVDGKKYENMYCL